MPPAGARLAAGLGPRAPLRYRPSPKTDLFAAAIDGQSSSYRNLTTYQPRSSSRSAALGVAFGGGCAVVGGAVDEDRHRAAGQPVGEVRPSVRLDRLLRGVGEPVAVVLEPLDEVLLKGGVRLGEQPDGVLGAGLAPARGERRAAGDGEQQVAGAVPVELLVVRLVAVAEQAVVAALAAWLGDVTVVVDDAAEVVAGVRVEVGDAQRFLGRLRERVPLGLQAAENARAALGGLGEQDAVARSLVGRQQLAVELGVLQLEGRLDAPLERVHDGQGGVDQDGARRAGRRGCCGGRARTG